ncbi:hypothetical protein FRB97_008024 [Tulasnella sp. 331]|nr:hypothetical protein FRB97_008024 [Tulasnella sp. 331]
MTESSPHTLTFGDRLGNFIILETAILSCIAVLTFLSFALWNALRPAPSTEDPQPQRRRWKFLSSTSDYYILGLLFFDLILSTGQILDARWVNLGYVVSGTYCMAQGIVQQIGDVGVALTSLAIACHTFSVLFFRWQAPKTKLLPFSVMALIFLFLLLATLIPALTRPDFWDISGDWCWISPKYSSLQLGLEYCIFWIVAISSFALYIPLFLCLRGNLLVDFSTDNWGKGRMHISWHWLEANQAWKGPESEGGKPMKAENKEQMAVARQMLAYPVVYTILILPSSIFRGLEDHHHIPSAAVAFSGIIYASSGIVNVGLYLITRPAVLEFLGNALCNRRTSSSSSSPSTAGNNATIPTTIINPASSEALVEGEYARSSYEKGTYEMSPRSLRNPNTPGSLRSPRELEEGGSGWRRERVGSAGTGGGRGEGGSSGYAGSGTGGHHHRPISDRVEEDMVPDGYSLNGDHDR